MIWSVLLIQSSKLVFTLVNWFPSVIISFSSGLPYLKTVGFLNRGVSWQIFSVGSPSKLGCKLISSFFGDKFPFNNVINFGSFLFKQSQKNETTVSTTSNASAVNGIISYDMKKKIYKWYLKLKKKKINKK